MLVKVTGSVAGDERVALSAPVPSSVTVTETGRSTVSTLTPPMVADSLST